MSQRSREAKRLRLGLPKGSLQQTTEKLFTLAGFDLRIGARSYYPEIGDPEIECILIRAQEMARYVHQGVLDVGITGIDWTLENRARVKELADLRAPWPNYNPVHWVVAVKENSKIRKPADLQGKRIATELEQITPEVTSDFEEASEVVIDDSRDRFSPFATLLRQSLRHGCEAFDI